MHNCEIAQTKNAFVELRRLAQPKAGFLEFTGQGLMTFERAMDRDERLMAFLGSRLLENNKKVGETAEESNFGRQASTASSEISH